MPIVIGMENGVARFESESQAGPSYLLQDTAISQLETSRDRDCIYAGTDQGVFKIEEDGVTSLGLSDEHVVSIEETGTDDLYAGTRPAHVFRSEDEGNTWVQLPAFDDIPGKEAWTQNYMGPAQVRDIRTHPQAPWKIYVAVETDGVYLSPDGGRTWEYRGRGLDNDPHGLRLVGKDSLIATCGRGLYRTNTAGTLWYRLDTHQKNFWFQYFREGIVHDGMYYTSVMDRAKVRHEDDREGRIIVSPDGGDTLYTQEFPRGSEDFVNAWTSMDDRVYGGTLDGTLISGPETWEHLTSVEGMITSLAML